MRKKKKMVELDSDPCKWNRGKWIYYEPKIKRHYIKIIRIEHLELNSFWRRLSLRRESDIKKNYVFHSILFFFFLWLEEFCYRCIIRRSVSFYFYSKFRYGLLQVQMQVQTWRISFCINRKTRKRRKKSCLLVICSSHFEL